ncbi:MAG: hypothetical protein AAGL11_07985 [Pseudomonadota bacterium]
MGTANDTCIISGVWSGRFRREHDNADPVPYSAWLNITNGRLAGSMLEPNSFAEGHGDELDATLRGHVDGNEVIFLKTYQGLDQEPIYYEGEIMDDGNRIVGRWYFGWPDEITGTFEMSRDGVRETSQQSSNERASS